MKRYLVFAGNSCYADGGWLDLEGNTDTIEEATAIALAATANISSPWHHVVDTTTMEIVSGVSGVVTGQLPDGEDISAPSPTK
jgi:hypothetical protein